MTNNSLALFEQQSIRRIRKDEERYFSLVDVIAILSESTNPTDYLKKLRKRDLSLGSYIGTNCPQEAVTTKTGVSRKTLVANTEHLLRIIQSIPSPKAEPFKLRLAQVGYQRIQEIEDPELAQERMKQLYEAKGYSKDWIDKRIRGIAIRQNLTDERKERGITAYSDYAILTAEISKATFGMTPSEYKDFKGLTTKGENLRDHMTDFELIFTMLGEKVTTEISHTEKPTTMPAHKKVARRGGSAAKIARQATEQELGRSIISDKNHNNLLA